MVIHSAHVTDTNYVNIFFLRKFEVEWTTWLYTLVQVGQHAKYGGLSCENVDSATYLAPGNVRWRLVCAHGFIAEAECPSKRVCTKD
jgi:hypothetical protein